MIGLTFPGSGMPAKIVAVVNQKGGAGKTTVTMQLAGALGRRSKVLVVDADPQETALHWASAASAEHPFPAAVHALAGAGAQVHHEVERFFKDYEIIFIDCPPAVESAAPQSALLVADLAIVPVIPSPVDLWASVAIKRLILNVCEINKDLRPRILVNQCQLNTSITKEILEFLPQFGIPEFHTRLHQRTAYRQAAAFGSMVHALRNPRPFPAIEEIDALAKEVVELLRAQPQSALSPVS